MQYTEVILAGMIILIAVIVCLLIFYSKMKRKNDILAHRIDKMLVESSRETAQRQENLSDRLNARMDAMSEANSNSMDALRTGINLRLDSSLGAFNEQLSRVDKDLGEMRSLAFDVNDIKKIMTNPRARGAWGEVELRSIFTEILTPEQYLENTPVVPGASERVEFAIKMPSGETNGVLLAVDSKFPTEDYLRIDTNTSNAFSRAVLTEAKRISDKYIRPPYTVDYAIMFLPAESVYAEACRTASLLETCRTKYRVLISGPATFAALLTSLRLGYRGLAMERRGEEISSMLSGIQAELKKYHETAQQALTRSRQLESELEALEKSARNVERKLKDAERIEL